MDRPLVTLNQAVDLAKEIWGLKVDSSSAKNVRELDSYDDRNFYLYGMKDDKEGEFLLKIYSPCFETRELVDAIHKIMFHLEDAGVVCPVPQKTMASDHLEIRNLPKTPNVQLVKKPKLDKKVDLSPCVVSLFTFVPGKTVKDYQQHGHSFSNEVYYQVGLLVANVANALKDLKCPVLEEREFGWDLFYFDTLLRGHDQIASEEKKIVKAVQNSFKKFVKPRLDVLPKQCIHGDINDGNILVQKNSGTDEFEVSGLIDFSDVNYSCRVFDIAIAASYMLSVSGDDVNAAASTVAGFHDKCPLTQDESDVILCCIRARMCQSICFGANTSALYPDNAKYLLYTANKAISVLKLLAEITNEDFDKRWRGLCRSK